VTYIYQIYEYQAYLYKLHPGTITPIKIKETLYGDEIDFTISVVDSDNNGNWVIAGSDIVLHGYKKSEEVIVKPSLFDVNAIGAASVYPLSDLTKVLEVIGRHDMSEEQAEDFKAAVEKLMQVVNDIYGK